MEVIRKAIAADLPGKKTAGISTAEKGRRIKTFIEHGYQFRDHYAKNPQQIPQEKVLLFYEAQRAWDADQVTRFTKKINTTLRT